MKRGFSEKVFFKRIFEAMIGVTVYDYLIKMSEYQFCSFLKEVYNKSGEIYSLNGIAKDKTDLFLQIFGKFFKNPSDEKLFADIELVVSKALIEASRSYDKNKSNIKQLSTNKHNLKQCVLRLDGWL